MSATPAQAHASPRSHQATPIDRRYSLRFAGTREEVEAALRLRFEVFNLELCEGFAESFFTGLDEDEFDRVCEHLIVLDEAGGKVVGIHRLQIKQMEKSGGRVTQ